MAEKKYNVAVVGANGAVGEEILTILQEIDFPLNKLIPLASARTEQQAGMVSKMRSF